MLCETLLFGVARVAGIGLTEHTPKSYPDMYTPIPPQPSAPPPLYAGGGVNSEYALDM